MKLLRIDSSILGSHSVSRQVSSDIVAHLRDVTSGIEVTYRDLAAAPLPLGNRPVIATVSARQPHYDSHS